jgi:hypothetical protein
LDEVTYGIGAVVDVEQRALRAFEQQVVAGLVPRNRLRGTSATIGFMRSAIAHASSVWWKGTGSAL